MIIKNILLSILIISCSRQETKEWSVSLNSVDAKIEIELPPVFDTIKRSVNLSDCRTCGTHYTVLINKNFINQIEDTTGFFTPWLHDSSLPVYFYIEEPLFPEPDIENRNINFEEELESIEKLLLIEKPETRILKKDIFNTMILVSYETFDNDGVMASKSIDCRVYFNHQFVFIKFIQNRDFQNDLIEQMWNSMQNMKLNSNNLSSYFILNFNQTS